MMGNLNEHLAGLPEEVLAQIPDEVKNAEDGSDATLDFMYTQVSMMHQIYGKGPLPSREDCLKILMDTFTEEGIDYDTDSERTIKQKVTHALWTSMERMGIKVPSYVKRGLNMMMFR